MKDIRLLTFGTLNEFFDLCNIVKSHAKKDSSWAKEIEKVKDTTPGQVRQFMEHPIKPLAMLQQLSTGIVRYRAHAVDIRDINLALVEQHRFLYANTCDEFFIKWSEYKKSHPLKSYLEMTLRKTDGKEHHVASFILLSFTLVVIFS
jgi:hypothetical protein